VISCLNALIIAGPVAGEERPVDSHSCVSASDALCWRASMGGDGRRDEMVVDAKLLGGLNWRNIGPHRGGRVVAVGGDPANPMTFYFGACGGGVWKSTDAGTYWENVSDGFFHAAAVGAIAVADSDPNVIYAGTGEACIRGNVIHGDGVYGSTDAGRTWKH